MGCNPSAPIFALQFKKKGFKSSNKCGSSSAGRASPCQGEGRGFESRLPLKITPDAGVNTIGIFFVATFGVLKLNILETKYELRDLSKKRVFCPGGGTGRHAGLKILFAATRVRVRFPSGALRPSNFWRVFFCHSVAFIGSCSGMCIVGVLPQCRP